MIPFQPILRARMRLRAKAAESEAQYRALLIKKLKFSIRKLPTCSSSWSCSPPPFRGLAEPISELAEGSPYSSQAQQKIPC
jgi:hypothetical protein